LLQQSLQILRADVWVSKLMASPHCSASSYGRCCAYALSDHKPRTMLRHDDSYKLNKCTLDVFAAVLAWPGRSSAQTRDCKAAVISSLLGQTQTSFGQSLNTHLPVTLLVFPLRIKRVVVPIVCLLYTDCPTRSQQQVPNPSSVSATLSKLCEVHTLRTAAAPNIHATSDYQHTARQHLDFQVYAKSRASVAVSQSPKGTLVAGPYTRPKASRPTSTQAQKRLQLSSTAAGFTTSSQACATQSVCI